MNILPKKSWHVRSRTNIDKVKKDKEKFKEQEQARLNKINIADSEFRINELRRKVPNNTYVPDSLVSKSDESYTTDDIIDPSTIKVQKAINHLEKVVESRQYEKSKKKIVTPQGNDFKTLQSWYDFPPERNIDLDDRPKEEEENSHDPLYTINLYKRMRHGYQKKTETNSELDKRKSSESSSSKIEDKNTDTYDKAANTAHNLLKKVKSKDTSLAKLREERRKREADEQRRQSIVLKSKITDLKRNSFKKFHYSDNSRNKY